MNFEIFVTLKVHGIDSMLVNDGKHDIWIKYDLIDNDSEIFEKTPVGASGVLVIPEEEAERLHLI